MSVHWFEETIVGRRPANIDLSEVMRDRRFRRRVLSVEFVNEFFRSLVLHDRSPALGRVPFVTQRFLGVR